MGIDGSFSKSCNQFTCTYTAQRAEKWPAQFHGSRGKTWSIPCNIGTEGELPNACNCCSVIIYYIWVIATRYLLLFVPEERQQRIQAHSCCCCLSYLHHSTCYWKSSCSRRIKKIHENCTILRQHWGGGIRSLLCSRRAAQEPLG